MCELVNFGGILPDDISRQIVGEWLDIYSLIALDNAHCSNESRDSYLRIMDKNCTSAFLYTDERDGIVKNVGGLIKWLQKRNAYTTGFIVPGELGRNKKIRLQCLNHFGPHVCYLSFESGYPYKKGATLFQEIAEYCPGITELDITTFCSTEYPQSSAMV